jgi:hypothetical protein
MGTAGSAASSALAVPSAQASTWVSRTRRANTEQGWAFGPTGLGQIGSGPLPFGVLAVALVIVGIIAILITMLLRQRR